MIAGTPQRITAAGGDMAERVDMFAKAKEYAAIKTREEYNETREKINKSAHTTLRYRIADTAWDLYEQARGQVREAEQLHLGKKAKPPDFMPEQTTARLEQIRKECSLSWSKEISGNRAYLVKECKTDDEASTIVLALKAIMVPYPLISRQWSAMPENKDQDRFAQNGKRVLIDQQFFDYIRPIFEAALLRNSNELERGI